MPPAEPDRLPGLDLIRGLAVMGIALMNVASFGLPPGAYDNPLAYGHASPLDQFVWAAEFIFVDGKLRALFSILFGASLMLMADREEARGGRPFSLHVRRMIVLLVIGLAHALLIWPGDILFMYAIAGLAAWWMRDKPVPPLIVAALICLAGQAAISGVTLSGLTALRDAAETPGANLTTAKAWTDLHARIGPDPAAAAQAVAMQRGSYGEGLVRRLDEAEETRVGQLVGAGLETLGLMLIGMAAMRSGALGGTWPRARYSRIAFAAVLAGALAGSGLLAICAYSRFDSITVYAAAVLGGAPLRPLMALGYAAAVLAIRPGALAARIAAVGRMALSCYIGTSIAFALLFEGYGLGLFGRLSRAETLLPVLAVWVLMLVLCPLWMRRYRHGPIEWLWRCAVRGTFRPIHCSFTIAT